MTTPNFRESEFACPCCGIIRVVDDLMVACQALRNAAGRPLTVTSGYRCPRHNRTVGGASRSMHMEGMAADLAAKWEAGFRPEDLARLALEIPSIGGVGLGGSFVHVDVRPRPGVRPVVWRYGNDGKPVEWRLA